MGGEEHSHWINSVAVIIRAGWSVRLLKGKMTRTLGPQHDPPTFDILIQCAFAVQRGGWRNGEGPEHRSVHQQLLTLGLWPLSMQDFFHSGVWILTNGKERIWAVWLKATIESMIETSQSEQWPTYRQRNGIPSETVQHSVTMESRVRTARRSLEGHIHGNWKQEIGALALLLFSGASLLISQTCQSRVSNH